MLLLAAVVRVVGVHQVLVLTAVVEVAVVISQDQYL
jgi:hypothetical protein